MKGAWTVEEWMAGRAARRGVCKLISEKECGRTNSFDQVKIQAIESILAQSVA